MTFAVLHCTYFLSISNVSSQLGFVSVPPNDYSDLDEFPLTPCLSPAEKNVLFWNSSFFFLIEEQGPAENLNQQRHRSSKQAKEWRRYFKARNVNLAFNWCVYIFPPLILVSGLSFWLKCTFGVPIYVPRTRDLTRVP